MSGGWGRGARGVAGVRGHLARAFGVGVALGAGIVVARGGGALGIAVVIGLIAFAVRLGVGLLVRHRTLDEVEPGSS